MAALLAHGLWAADDGEYNICLVIGPSVELLMWIPEPGTVPGPNALRPLQLPTCMRRLYGAMVRSLVRPHVEPMSSEDNRQRNEGTADRTLDWFSSTSREVARH